ncbi:MAG: hypothetical protein LBT40_17980 [Deltaproteobacteria bacterium]|nr:hypothetical protein [Deltaproteobacteria bacterium]
MPLGRTGTSFWSRTRFRCRSAGDRYGRAFRSSSQGQSGGRLARQPPEVAPSPPPPRHQFAGGLHVLPALLPVLAQAAVLDLGLAQSRKFLTSSMR